MVAGTPMNWFGLDPQSIAARVQASGRAPKPLSLGQSLAHGSLGFTLLGLAGFLPWALGWGRTLGEGGMYLACAVAFVGLSGPLLHRLIIGPGSLSRCYALFGVAFVAYAVVWCAVWFGARFKFNDYVGLALGLTAFGWIVAAAFGATAAAPRAILALILLNAAGYYAGGLAYADIGARREWEILGTTLGRRECVLIARLSWGLFYGLGFGAGLGIALYLCQANVRAALAITPQPGLAPSR
jgi:hypothetical protein